MELTALGVIAFVITVVSLSEGKNSKNIILFLSVLLLSMILINWKEIKPLFIKEG